MNKLLDVYNELVKEAEATPEIDQEKLAEVAKYAEAADTLLANEYGEDYNENDVEELAEMMLAHDIAVEEDEEKVAELDYAGRVMARAFIDELNSAK